MPGKADYGRSAFVLFIQLKYKNMITKKYRRSFHQRSFPQNSIFTLNMFCLD